MFQSPVAEGIAFGLGVNCLWLIPVGFAILTKTGFGGFVGCTVVLLVAAAAVAEILARKKRKAA